MFTVTNNTAVIRTEHGQLCNSQMRQPGHTHYKNHQFRLGYDWQLEKKIKQHPKSLSVLFDMTKIAQIFSFTIKHYERVFFIIYL